MSEEWPQVSILLITYKRYELALRTIKGVCRNLYYMGPLHWHIADDGSGGGHVLALQNALKEYAPASTVTISNTQRAGVGRSMNVGQAECWKRSDYVLWLEDDWELYQPLDLAPCVRVLRECQDIGMIRLGYMQVNLAGTLRAGAGHLWWRLSWESEDPYIFAGHAALRHRRFIDAYGPYPEGLTPGDTEAAFAHHINQVRGPAVLWPGWIGCWGPFGHNGAESLAGVVPGTDWQGQETRESPHGGAWVPPTGTGDRT